MPKQLPVIPGPPGHEHLPHLPPPEHHVRDRKVTPMPAGARRAARVVAEALFSPDGEAPDAERLDWLEEDFSDFYARAHGNARMILRLSLFALMWVAPLFAFKFGTLAMLSIRARIEVLEKFEGSFLAPAALAVKAMLCILWFEHPATQLETNTAPTCMKVAS
ncbi:MAG: hypothetical protein ACXWUG_00060 [Polyangiales bacterium]